MSTAEKLQKKSVLVSVPSLGLDTLDNLQCEDIVLWIASDERPLKAAAGYVDWRCNGWLSRLITSGQFRCERDERLLTLSAGRINQRRVFLVGIGEGKGFHARSAEELGSATAEMLGQAAAQDVAFGLPGTGDPDAHAQLLATLQKQLTSAKMTSWGPWRKM